MSECVNKYFIFDEDTKLCEDFNESFLIGGKSLYEVIRIIDGKPLFLKRHLNRLKNSGDLINLKIWLSKDIIKKRIQELVEVNDIKVGNIKIIFKFDDINSFFAYFVKYHYPVHEEYEDGVKTILYHGERDNPNAKVINISFRTEVDNAIKEKNAYEAILVNKKGYLTEGSKSNIFLVKEDTIITAPLLNVLPGITREVILELCKDVGLNIIEKNVHYEELTNYDGLFISGTSPKVLPISTVEDLKFDSAKNENVLKIMKNYNQIIEEEIKNFSY